MIPPQGRGCSSCLSCFRVFLFQDEESPALFIPKQASAHCPKSDASEREPGADLNESRTGCRRNFAVKRRGKVRGRRVETHHVEGIGGFTAYLQHESLTEADVAEDAQIDIAITGRTKIVARSIPIGSVRPYAKSRSVVSERVDIEPLIGCNEAISMGAEERILA